MTKTTTVRRNNVGSRGMIRIIIASMAMVASLVAMSWLEPQEHESGSQPHHTNFLFPLGHTQLQIIHHPNGNSVWNYLSNKRRIDNNKRLLLDDPNTIDNSRTYQTIPTIHSTASFAQERWLNSKMQHNESELNKTSDRESDKNTISRDGKSNNAEKATRIRLRNGRLQMHLRPSWTLPTPIIVASLPKSATTSTYRYFKCGGYKSVHHWGHLNQTQQHADNVPNGYSQSGNYRPAENEMSPLRKAEESLESNVDKEHIDVSRKSTKPSRHNRKQVVVGRCIQNNVATSRPPLYGCGDYSVWADAGYTDGNRGCFYMELDALEELYAAYPQMTLVLVTRPTTDWYESLVRHAKGRLVRQWTKFCNATGFPPKQKWQPGPNHKHNDSNYSHSDKWNTTESSKNATPTMSRRMMIGKYVEDHEANDKEDAQPNSTISDEDQYWKSFYEWHTRRIRQFAESHNSTMTYIEVDVEDPTVAQQLHEATGINPICWGQKNKHREK